VGVAEEENISALDLRHVWHPFTQEGSAAPLPEIVSGEGAWLRTADGRDILDLISSWWVTLHGHAHPAIARAVAEQAEQIEQVMFAGFTHAPAVRLASRLVALMPRELTPPLTRVFFSDNGSTAVEVALKIAWQYWRNKGEMGRKRFLAFSGGYHGDTLGAMSVGASTGFYTPFDDLMLPVTFLPFPATWEGDNEAQKKEEEALARVDAALDSFGAEVAAVIIEPLVQGAGGMRMCRPEFLRALCERIRNAGILLIFDEVMTGFGRTGTMFACNKAQVVPDIICLAKGLTSGFLPLATTICGEEIHYAFLGGDFGSALAHGHSFTANPLGCAAALASLDLFESDSTLERVAAMEDIHRRRMRDLARLSNVRRIRVMGAIAAFDLDCEYGEGGGDGDGDAGDDKSYGSSWSQRLRGDFLSRGLLLRPLGNVVYLMPPYCVSEEDLHHAYDEIFEVVSHLQTN
jgi:adenosylmethionine-8-amino-7-oxononanoate aminotransferase